MRILYLHRYPYHPQHLIDCSYARNTPLGKVYCNSAHYFFSNQGDRQIHEQVQKHNPLGLVEVITTVGLNNTCNIQNNKKIYR